MSQTEYGRFVMATITRRYWDWRNLRIDSCKKTKELEVDKYFRALVKLEGSDLHMKVGQPPIVRVNGKLKPLNRGPIDAEEMCRLVVPDDERAAPRNLRPGRRRRLRLYGRRGRRDLAFPCQHADADGQDRPGRPPRQQLDPRLRRPESAADHGRVCASTTRA